MSIRMRCALLALLFASCTAQALSVDELISKNVEARGGMNKIDAIKSIRFEGSLRFAGPFGSIDLSMRLLKKAPDRVRNEASVQGLTQIQAWDGKEAWQVSPFQGRKDPERLSEDDARALSDAASIGGPLVNYRSRGSTAEYLGTEDVDGTEAHKLKVTLKNGNIETVYLDPDHFIEIRVVGQRKVRGTTTEDITDYGDYEQVAGVWFPFSIISRTKGSGGQQQITIEKAEVNSEMADSLFSFPGKSGSNP